MGDISIDQVRAYISQAIGNFNESTAYLQGARGQAEEGRALLYTTLEGSGKADVTEVLGMASRAMETMDEAGQALQAAINAANDVMARL